MNELSKIKDVTAKFEVTTRTLHYYEKMGLLQSSRCETSGYRLYDQIALSRLKQILILRKMNISIRDIKEIFDAQNSDTVLSVLDRKVDDIDSEVALLHELKEIVLEFIKQIKQADFHNEDHVKLLYDKAMEIEIGLSTDEGLSIPTSELQADNLEKLEEVTEKLDERRIAMPMIIRTYRQDFGAVRYIGKKYDDGAVAFAEWEANSEILKREIYFLPLDTYEDAKTTTAMMAISEQGFEFWLGYFAQPDSPVPQGFSHVDFPEMGFAVGWMYGTEEEMHAQEAVVCSKLQEEGYEILTHYWFERYDKIRDKRDENGNMITDFGFFVK